MNDTERKEAARVMASDGPWEFCEQGDGNWIPCQAHPAFDWSKRRYRIRPSPPPAPLPCPFCGDTAELRGTCWSFEHKTGCWWHQTDINVQHVQTWNRRAPCQSCAEAIAEAAQYRDARMEAEAERDDMVAERDAAVDRAEAAEKLVAVLRQNWKMTEVVRDKWKSRAEAAEKRLASPDSPEAMRAFIAQRQAEWRLAEERAEKAEKRCAEAARKLRAWAGKRSDWHPVQDVIATLEGRDHA